MQQIFLTDTRQEWSWCTERSWDDGMTNMGAKRQRAGEKETYRTRTCTHTHTHTQYFLFLISIPLLRPKFNSCPWIPWDSPIFKGRRGINCSFHLSKYKWPSVTYNPKNLCPFADYMLTNQPSFCYVWFCSPQCICFINICLMNKWLQLGSRQGMSVLLMPADAFWSSSQF